jgi:hypothetical protein
MYYVRSILRLTLFSSETIILFGTLAFYFEKIVLAEKGKLKYSKIVTQLYNFKRDTRNFYLPFLLSSSLNGMKKS